MRSFQVLDRPLSVGGRVYVVQCKMKFCNFVCLLLLFSCQLSGSLDVSFTLSIPPRRRDCFHQAITEGVEYEVEYQVSV